jgi:hypothetical protein
MELFTKNGRLNFPENQFKGFNEKIRSEKKIKPNIVTEAYCPNGCSLIEKDYPINGYPGLRIAFEREGSKGEFVLSAIENDFDKIILSGTLMDGVKDELLCPHCDVMLAKLVNCSCQPEAEMVIIGLTPGLDYNNAITFCNVTGCKNGATIESGKIIRRVRLLGEV